MKDDATTPAGLPVTEILAQWISGPALADLPASLTDHLKLAILDTVGCGLFGATQPWSVHAAAAAHEMASGSCLIFGNALTAGPAAWLTDAAESGKVWFGRAGVTAARGW